MGYLHFRCQIVSRVEHVGVENGTQWLCPPKFLNSKKEQRHFATKIEKLQTQENEDFRLYFEPQTENNQFEKVDLEKKLFNKYDAFDDLEKFGSSYVTG